MARLSRGWVPSREARKNHKAVLDVVERFNQAVPVGSAVNVQLDDGSIVRDTVHKPAKLIGSHVPAVFVEGLGGFYILDRVKLATGDGAAN